MTTEDDSGKERGGSPPAEEGRLGTGTVTLSDAFEGIVDESSAMPFGRDEPARRDATGQSAERASAGGATKEPASKHPSTGTVMLGDSQPPPAKSTPFASAPSGSAGGTVLLSELIPESEAAALGGGGLPFDAEATASDALATVALDGLTEAPGGEQTGGGGTVALADMVPHSEKPALPFGAAGAPVVPPLRDLAGAVPQVQVRPPDPLAVRDARGPAPEVMAPKAVSRMASGLERAGGNTWVDNPTPLTVAMLGWEERCCLTVVLKASCDIVPDAAAVYRQPGEAVSGEQAGHDELGSFVTYPSDRAHFKARADVVVTGAAYAPKPETRSMSVRLGLGEDDKLLCQSLHVTGPRRWEPALAGLKPSAPEVFDLVPMRWAYAYGGNGHGRNPVGRGKVDPHGQGGDESLPQLERPDRLIRRAIQQPEPGCWAPIAEAWTTQWVEQDDESVFARFTEAKEWGRGQAAPAEMRCAFLQGDEPFRIEGMHPRHASVSGRLPGKRVRLFAARAHGAMDGFFEVPLRLDTAVFAPDALRVTLVYRGQITVSAMHDQAETHPEVASLHVRLEPSEEQGLSVEEWRRSVMRG